MKKLHKILLFSAIFAAFSTVHAAPSFSGAIGGSVGFDLDFPLSGGSVGHKVPLSGFAAVQANLTNWCVARGEIAIDASNFEFDDIFGSAQAAIKLNELSVVLIHRTVTASSFFSGFLGSSDQIGSDSFLMRQFGIEPISSRLSRSATNLAGLPILRSKGAGISYIVNFDKAPVATGAYFYYGKNSTSDKTLNIDARVAYASNLVTLDFLAGISAPFQDKYNNEDVVFMINTLKMHGGINFLAGSKYTHSLFMQVGIKDITVKGSGAGETTGDELSFLLEPRINFKKFRMNLTVFAYDSESVRETIYLSNEMGAAFTFYKDDIETKNGFLTLGIHVIGGIGEKNALDFFKNFNLTGATYNAYVTPFVELPLSQSSSLEAMTQIGLKDLSGSPTLGYKIAASVKKTF